MTMAWLNRKKSKGQTETEQSDLYVHKKTQTTISSLQYHSLKSNTNSGQIEILLTLSMTDTYFCILQYLPDLKHFREIMKIKTIYPIIYVCFDQGRFQDNLCAYLVDIFGNIYSVNVQQVNALKRVKTKQEINPETLFPQPSNQFYDNMYLNADVQMQDFQSKISQQIVVLLYLHKKMLFTFNLKGWLKIIKSESLQLETTVKFKHQISCATLASFKDQPIACVIFNNSQPPYLFKSCKKNAEYQQMQSQLNEAYSDSQEIVNLVSYVSYNQKSSKIVCGTEKGNLYIFEVDEEEFRGTNLILCFLVFQWQLSKATPIQSLHCNFSYAAVGLANKVIIFDLHKLSIVNEKQVKQLKWVCLVDIAKQMQSNKQHVVVIATGYNHLDETHSVVSNCRVKIQRLIKLQ